MCFCLRPASSCYPSNTVPGYDTAPDIVVSNYLSPCYSLVIITTQTDTSISGDPACSADYLCPGRRFAFKALLLLPSGLADPAGVSSDVAPSCALLSLASVELAHTVVHSALENLGNLHEMYKNSTNFTGGVCL